MQCTKAVCLLCVNYSTAVSDHMNVMSPYLEGDSVVDDHGHTKHIGGVLGVCKLGVKIESEARIIIHLLVSQHHKLSALDTLKTSQQQSIKQREYQQIAINLSYSRSS